jgi:hypothetical protein
LRLNTQDDEKTLDTTKHKSSEKRTNQRNPAATLAVKAWLVLQRNVNLFAALLRSHTRLTTSRGGITIPSGGPVEFASSGGLDPTLHFGIEGAAKSLDETRGNLSPPTSCAPNVRPGVLADVDDTFFENNLSRYLVPELRIYEDLDICQHIVLNLDKYVLRIVLAGVGMTRGPAESDLNVLDFLTSEITDRVELVDNRIIDEHLVGEILRRFGNSMRAVEHQELPQLAGRD